MGAPLNLGKGQGGDGGAVSWKTLQTRLLSNYELREVQLTLEGHSLKLTKVADIDALLDKVSDADRIPFWAELWPASIGLARFILQRERWFSGHTLLELGSGIGLAGIAAKLAGASVVQSDFLEEAFTFIRLNCIRNGVEPDPLLLADWRSFPQHAGGFDWVIGADILYEKTLHDSLEKVLHQVVKVGGGVLLADPGRGYAAQFIERLIAAGWQCRKLQLPVVYEERNYQIDIYQLQPKGTGDSLISL